MKSILIFVVLFWVTVNGQHLVSESAAGGVTENSAKFRVNISSRADVNIKLSLSPNFSNPIIGTPVRTDTTRDNTAIISIENLLPSTKYYYQVLINGSPADNKRRSFSTFPAAGTNPDFTFAFGSCQQSQSDDQGEIYHEIVKHNPDLFLQIGDWTYPDTTDHLPSDPDFFSNSYERVLSNYRSKFRMNYGMDTLLRSIPVSYVYDDHDFMNNNASSGSVSYAGTNSSNIGSLEEIPFPFYARLNVIKAFLENMADYEVENPSRGIYRKFTAGSAEFYVLDLRAQRSPVFNSLRKNLPTGKWEFIYPENHTILGNSGSPGEGEDQFTWLKRNLLTSTAKWKFIFSSVPFNRGQIESLKLGIALQDSLIPIPNTNSSVPGIGLAIELVDKWVGYFQELEALLGFIKDNNIANVFVLSGDSHTAAMDDGSNAGLPEIMSANLDIRNSRTAAALYWLGADIWNKGIQGVTNPTTNNTFGYVKIFGKDSVSFNIIDETGENIMRMTMFDQSLLPGITGLSAVRKGNMIQMSWRVPVEDNIRNFEIQSSADGITFRGKATVNVSGVEYSYSDVFEEKSRYFRIKVNGINGSFKFSDQIILERVETDKSYTLYQNYPNPFNPVTRINYSIPREIFVSIKLYDILGKEIRTLVSGYKNAGIYVINFNGKELPSGTYIVNMIAGDFNTSKKIILLK